MAKNDMHVIVYRILSYLYNCMKQGCSPDNELFSAEALGIPEQYWSDIMREMHRKGYIAGVMVYCSPNNSIQVRLNRPYVTLDGHQYLQENSMMAKARDFMKETKATVPFI